jgi:hypothetical protein
MRLDIKHGEMAMAKRYIIRLNDEERKQLRDLLGKKHLGAKKRTRAHVLLKADASKDGMD